MGKIPRLDISLKQFEKLVLNTNPMFNVIPLKVKMTFTELNSTELKNLEEYANIVDGTIERWLLVPDVLPLGALSYIIDRAFGLLPEPNNVFVLPDEDWFRVCPDMGVFMDYCGSVFDNPTDIAYSECMGEVSYSNKRGFPPIFPALVLPSFVTYEDAQKAVKESFSDLLGKKIDYKGKKMKFEECPADLDFFASYSGKGEEFMFFDNLALDMQLRDVLQREGRKLYSLRDRPVTKRALDDKRKAKPFTEKLLMVRPGDEGEDAYTFEISIPENVYSIINEGFLSVEDYVESIKYVLRNCTPDCIYKKGYDLFGPDQLFYHDFIMAIHSGDAESYMQEAKSCGWKEPYVALKWVLR